MNNKKYSIGEENITIMGWANIDVYHPAVATGLLLIAGIQVLYCHSFLLAPGEAPS